MSAGLDPRLLRGLYPVRSPLQAERYRRAVERITGRRITLPTPMHVDALGFSPEVAAALGDPCYLGHGPDHPFYVVVTVDQLDARIVHPSAGLGHGAWSTLTRHRRRELAVLTLHDALYGEFEHGLGRLTEPEQLAHLARVDTVRMTLCTLRNTVEDGQRLSAFAREMVASDTLWHDEEAIGEMLAVARRVREVAPLTEALQGVEHAAGCFFTPVLDGTYVYREERFGRGSACVLTSVGGDGTLPLDTASVVEFLQQRKLAAIDAAGHLRDPSVVRRKLHWLAIAHLAEVEGVAAVAELGADEVERAVRVHTAASPERDELGVAWVRLQQGAPESAFEDLSPATRLRLLVPTVGRGDVRRFVLHLQASLDPLDLGGLYRCAPDRLFARLPELPEPLRAQLGRWLDEDGAPAPGVGAGSTRARP